MIHLVVVSSIALAVLLLILLSTYNGLMHLRQEVRLAWAKMDDQLKNRYDLIPELITAVRASGGEAATKLSAISAAKNQAAVAFNPEQLASAEGKLTIAIHDLLAVAGRAAALNANPSFADICQKLLSNDKRINLTCKRYNDAVNLLNESRRSFPTAVTAALVGLKSQPLFVLPVETM